jgi:hypothetical protein
MLNSTFATSHFNRPIPDTGECSESDELRPNVNKMSYREDTREQNVIAGKRDYAVNGRDHAVNGLAPGREGLINLRSTSSRVVCWRGIVHRTLAVQQLDELARK